MRCARNALLALATVLSLVSAASADAVREQVSETTRTDAGLVQGLRDGDLQVYKGVPFAAPPLGERRWRPPAAVAPWAGVKATTAFAPACMQPPNPLMNLPAQPVSEDCLYLNIWSPAREPGARLAVLVWIHGGGFSYGSTAMPLFDGSALARRGVVFVSLAYRVGPFGFLAHPDLSAESPDGVSGNYGLLDQIAGLDWIRRNITAFGGDPGRVTIMGESAGGTSVALLAQSPLAAGLFRGVISQSAASFALPSEFGPHLKDAEAAGSALAKSMHAPSIEGLRAMPAEAFLRATPPGPSPFSLASSWPVLDGHVLPRSPAALHAARRRNATPILIGANDQEGDLFSPAKSKAAFEADVRTRFGPAAAKVLAAYPATNDLEATRVSADLFGDWAFGVQNWVWARRQAASGQGAVFMYHFDHDPPARPGVPAGPIHGAELPYVFERLDLRPLAWTQADRALSTTMATYWTNFAKHGDPNGEGVPSWPTFTLAAPDVLHFTDQGPEIGSIPHGARLQVMDAVLAAQRRTPGSEPKP